MEKVKDLMQNPNKSARVILDYENDLIFEQSEKTYYSKSL